MALLTFGTFWHKKKVTIDFRPQTRIDHSMGSFLARLDFHSCSCEKNYSASKSKNISIFRPCCDVAATPKFKTNHTQRCPLKRTTFGVRGILVPLLVQKLWPKDFFGTPFLTLFFGFWHTVVQP